MSQPKQQPFTLNMTPGSRIRMDKYFVGPEGIQVNCGTPTHPPPALHGNEYIISTNTQLKMKVQPGQSFFMGPAAGYNQKKIDLVCKSK